MRTLALFLLSSLVASGVGSGAPRADSIPGGLIVVASARADLDLVARPLAGGPERVLLAGLDSPTSPTVSPDGRTIVYVRVWNGRADLFALDVESGDRRALTNDARWEQAPAFSPDGSEIAYVSSRAYCGEQDRNCDRLEVLSLADGRLRLVLAGDRLYDPAWSPDGRRIAFLRNSEVSVIGSHGGEPSRVTSGQYGLPSWSPDGSRIVVEKPGSSAKVAPILGIVDMMTLRVSLLEGFVGAAPVWLANGRIRFIGAGSNLFDVDPDGTRRARVTTGGGVSREWATTSRDVLDTREVGGRSMLYVLGDDGSVSRRLSGRDATLPALSPDGRKVAFVAPATGTRTTAVYVIPIAGGAVRKVAATPRRIMSEPSWSPDGKRIAFEIRGGIATVAATGGLVAHVRGTLRDDESPAWAPGGREIAFVRLRRAADPAHRDSLDVWVASTRTGRTRVLVRDGSDPAWSPSGRSIAFASDRTSFYPAIWTVRRDGTARTRLTRSHGYHFGAAWSPDGRWLAFRRDDDAPGLDTNSGIWLIPAGGGTATRISSEASQFTWGRAGS